MNKFICLTAILFVAIGVCHGWPFVPPTIPNVLGGFIEQPDLTTDNLIISLTIWAARQLEEAQNLILKNINVIKVETQVVSGVNYKIRFETTPVLPDGTAARTIQCDAIIYLPLNGEQRLLEGQCQTS
ncbi:unnamed protein product [Didymodactylos carnosus]|uniref:Cystatin n=1 Tax=Didymodactylos carnosus TaxID=1234261 RepID=A0A814CGD6_9BILA|nr:unnamed protein product [Didymodactylos carnosus]CAF1353849.1 unnamed protein product [Didymodactylos carnosus]CAF3718586.1 unnamed protein product [Didymodactylos carnosus]CAF4164338.1 unnamed protein product [Didymodactylos carnosus]